MTLGLTAPLPGFRDRATSSRVVFRLLLEAMAQPGQHKTIPAGGALAPAGAPISAAAVLLTLLDHETTFWASPDFAASEIRAWVAFHTGAPFAQKPDAANFVLASGGSNGPALASFNAGDDRYPDRSATVLIACESLSGGREAILSGPGIETTRTIAPRGLRASFWDEARANNARFPLGVDLIMCAGSELLAISRSSAIDHVTGAR